MFVYSAYQSLKINIRLCSCRSASLTSTRYLSLAPWHSPVQSTGLPVRLNPIRDIIKVLAASLISNFQPPLFGGSPPVHGVFCLYNINTLVHHALLFLRLVSRSGSLLSSRLAVATLFCELISHHTLLSPSDSLCIPYNLERTASTQTHLRNIKTRYTSSSPIAKDLRSNKRRSIRQCPSGSICTTQPQQSLDTPSTTKC